MSRDAIKGWAGSVFALALATLAGIYQNQIGAFVWVVLVISALIFLWALNVHRRIKAAFLAFIHLDAATRPDRSEPRSFNPWSLRIGVDHVHLLGLANTDPTVTFRLIIENMSDREIQLAGIKGEVSCRMLFGGSSSEAGTGLGPAKLHNEIKLPTRDRWNVSFSQVFSPALGRKMIDTLRQDGNALEFDFGTVKLLGRESDEVIPVARVQCWIKSPFPLDDRDQDTMHQIQPGGLISQVRFDLYTNRRESNEE